MTAVILGPVRSGKSARAGVIAEHTGKAVIYAATAAVDATDHEMVARIARHRADRPLAWRVIETAAPEGPSLPSLLRDAQHDECILVDSLGTWLAAMLLDMESKGQTDVDAALAMLEKAGEEFAQAVTASHADVVVVAEETGWGVVPVSAQGRVFRDAMGRLVQRLTKAVDRVELVVAGYAVDLRAIGRPITDAASL